MVTNPGVMKNEEQMLLDLCSLYHRYGYKHYKVNKFEEYDLYARNKSFLVSDDVLTFNDAHGRLLALKPDVTLSIVKHHRSEDEPSKLYYSEHVYRAVGEERQFREIMQVGLEYIGRLDVYAMAEVILLALRSLQQISDNYLLDLSHMGFISGLMEDAGLDNGQIRELLPLIGEKNAHGIRQRCAAWGLDEVAQERISCMASLYKPFAEALPVARSLSSSARTDQALDELEQIYGLLQAVGCADKINLDFSIINDMRYYSGVTFRGFIKGIMSGILSGGRYDNLLAKFGKPAGAIGFAVYLNLLERWNQPTEHYDADVLLLYDEATDPAQLLCYVEQLVAEGKQVLARQGEQGKLLCREVLQVKEGRLEKVD